ncbi:transposase [Polaromonas naphthalenivorans]|uniref:transposase n=1 Tax=Polaromonas naphthalenivorans TaxID=216465 RepID=UPI001E2FC565|nr:transposase [Polaromonas naphthalenivorans]
MDKSKLSDGEWVHLIGKLKKTPGIRVGCEATCRRFVEAVLWMLRSGAQWRLLPDRLGHLAQRVQAFFQLEPVWRVGADACPCISQG